MLLIWTVLNKPFVNYKYPLEGYAHSMLSLMIFKKIGKISEFLWILKLRVTDSWSMINGHSN